MDPVSVQQFISFHTICNFLQAKWLACAAALIMADLFEHWMTCDTCTLSTQPTLKPYQAERNTNTKKKRTQAGPVRGKRYFISRPAKTP